METWTRRWWRLLAIVLVFWLAGPEIFIYAEGMAIMEALGAATFVFMYVVAAKLIIKNIWDAFFEFENRYHFFLPSLTLILRRPGLLYYAIPRRSLFYVVFGLLPGLIVASLLVT